MAATITMTLTGDTIGTVEGTFSTSDTGAERLLAWAIANYGTDAEGQERTPQASVQAAMQAVCQGTLDNANRLARLAAAAAVEAQVVDATIEVVEPG